MAWHFSKAPASMARVSSEDARFYIHAIIWKPRIMQQWLQEAVKESSNTNKPHCRPLHRKDILSYA